MIIKMEMSHLLFFCVVLLLNVFGNCQLYGGSKNAIRDMCPRMYSKIFRGYVPRGNLAAGTFTEIIESTSLKQCVFKCCISSQCNVAFTNNDQCYHILCRSSELCAPTLSFNENATEHVAMVLVSPVLREDSWASVIEQDFQNEEETADNEIYNMLNDPRRLENAYKTILDNIGEPTFDYTSCTVGIDETCSHNEECVQNFPKSRAGTCRCKSGYIRKENRCVIEYEYKDKPLEGITESMEPPKNISVAVEKKKLIVTAQSKEVKLPDSEVSIKAFVKPLPSEGTKYQYDWTSLNQPRDSSAVKHQSDDEMHLSKLSEGLYTFKISVSSADAYGEAFVNVSVLPPSRINKPPQIVITPANQTIKLPNTGAVLDASSSTDDGGIVSFHWELQQGPLGYEPQLKDTPTLQLNDLTRPGNYTFKLTVTNSDKATNSSTANITVLKVTDYPPEANAGPDVIIFLPQNQITLNGTISTDDHAITTWEWTNGDTTKAVDMQDTRTPYLRLSDLEEGIYTFTLKVTDSANQSSSAVVHVFVKPLY